MQVEIVDFTKMEDAVGFAVEALTDESVLGLHLIDQLGSSILQISPDYR
jgi:hypothetical protein